MKRKFLYFIFVSFLLFDVAYSFRQHYSKPLDGDMAGGIVPNAEVDKIFKDPFGIHLLLTKEKHSNPNRFFSHWIFRKYFISMPSFLQRVTGPMNSIYLSCAIIKTLVQVLMIVLLAAAISGKWNPLNFNFVIAAALITPLFQTNGFARTMGIIDSSITYTFFYALPAALLMIYFTPFLVSEFIKKRYKIQFLLFLMLPLGIVICFSGPLNPGVVLIVSVMLVFSFFTRHETSQGSSLSFFKFILKVPGWYWLYMFPVVVFSIYSLYLGKYNTINEGYSCSILERYSRLPGSIYYHLTHNPGYALMILIILLNSFLIRRNIQVPGDKTQRIIKWTFFFSAFYIVLLPLGGYREWRHEILRYDTMIPVSISLIFAFGLSTLFMLVNMPANMRKWYIPIIITVLMIYTISDKGRFYLNECEKDALSTLSQSQNKVVVLENGCTVVSWEKIIKPEDSEMNARLLHIWKITDEPRLYYSQSNIRDDNH